MCCIVEELVEINHQEIKSCLTYIVGRERESVTTQTNILRNACFLLCPLQPLRIVYMGPGPMDYLIVTLVLLLFATMVCLTLPSAVLLSCLRLWQLAKHAVLLRPREFGASGCSVFTKGNCPLSLFCLCVR